MRYWNLLVLVLATRAALLVNAVGCPAAGKRCCGGDAAGFVPGKSEVSALYGCDGDKYKVDGRLQDWSRAGYKGGAPLPAPGEPRVNVQTFGAVGDNKTDNTEAFEAAIRATPNGATLFVPAGWYRLSRNITIRKSIIIRGAGRDRTVLYFTRSFQLLYGNDFSGPPSGSGWPTSQWSSQNSGLLEFKGKSPPMTKQVAKVTATARRGGFVLQVSSTAGIRPGWVLLVQDNRADGGLWASLHGNLEKGNPLGVWRDMLQVPVNVLRALPRKRLLLGNPLPVNVSTQWNPRLYELSSDVRGAGLDSLTLRMPLTRYPEHHLEEGWHGVSFNGTVDCFLRNVRVHNADGAVRVHHTHFCTLDDVLLSSDDRGLRANDSSVKGRVINGHHGFVLSHATHVLVRNFNISSQFFHDTSVVRFSTNCVFSNGRGADVNFDSHKVAPFGTLYTNVDVGKGTRVFKSGGEAGWGPHSAAFGTYWLIRSDKRRINGTLTRSFGPLLNFVAAQLTAPKVMAASWKYENIAPHSVFPVNLHRDMVQNLPTILTRSLSSIT